MQSGRQPRKLTLAAHFFADCGMGNFWSTFRRAQVAEQFDRIRSDGFSHVILVVPWAQFQPRVAQPDLDPLYVARLIWLLDAADSAGLQVITRLGYLWEFTPLRINSFQRYVNFLTEAQMRNAWSGYFREMRALLSAHPAFDFAFVSWEEWYWPIFRRLCNQPESKRLPLARQLGFTEYLQQRWNLSDFTATYGLAAESWDAIAIPRHSDPLMLEFASFHDSTVTERILNLAVAAFPGLGYEARVDPELVLGADGTRAYAWRPTFPATGRALTFYHPNIGQLCTRTLSASSALHQLRGVGHAYAQACLGARHKVFIDQFNFVTSNPDYSHFSSIAPEELETFIDGAAEVIRNLSSGYGVWGYRDWPNDKIFNGAFELGAEGWNLSGGARVGDSAGSTLICPEGAVVSQSLYQGTPGTATLFLETLAGAAATLRVSADGNPAKSIDLEASAGGRSSYSLPFEVRTTLQLAVVSGSVEISRIGLCSHIYSSGLYGVDMSERAAVASVRRLNSRLASRQEQEGPADPAEEP